MIRTVTTGLTAGVLALALAGCTPTSAGPPPGIQLSSELTTQNDVALRWTGHGDRPTILEFATERDGQYTILDFLPPERATYEHPDLLPQTTFYYRVRPVLGPVSGETTAVPATVAVPAGSEDWLPPRTRPDPLADPVPVRERAAAPANVTVESVAPDGVLVSWTDNATGEDGFLIEARPAESAPFEVLFVVDPDVNTVGLITAPAEPAAFRVRAYYFGARSNVTEHRTGGS